MNARFDDRTGTMKVVLLFEFFPAFITIVGVLAAIALFVADRRSRNDSSSDRKPRRPKPASDGANERASEHRPRRPSMTA